MSHHMNISFSSIWNKYTRHGASDHVAKTTDTQRKLNTHEETHMIIHINPNVMPHIIT